MEDKVYYRITNYVQRHHFLYLYPYGPYSLYDLVTASPRRQLTALCRLFDVTDLLFRKPAVSVKRPLKDATSFSKNPNL